MPELPEVETIRRTLYHGGHGTPSLLLKRILGVDLLWERTLAMPSPAEFQARIQNQVIEDIRRRGKYLVFSLSNDTLVFHLRMSGDILVEPFESPPAPHHRLLVNMNEGIRLAFNDTRKFGRVWLTEEPEVLFAHLGPEPLDPALTVELFYNKLQSRRRQLKPLIMDQGFLVGLGNIYTDEALHKAKLHPLTISNQLTMMNSDHLLNSIRLVLDNGIKRNGASIDWVYRGGEFQNYFQVYQRTDQPCYTCNTPIKRILVSQRGTHYCPNCQPIPDS